MEVTARVLRHITPPSAVCRYVYAPFPYSFNMARTVRCDFLRDPKAIGSVCSFSIQCLQSRFWLTAPGCSRTRESVSSISLFIGSVNGPTSMDRLLTTAIELRRSVLPAANASVVAWCSRVIFFVAQFALHHRNVTLKPPPRQSSSPTLSSPPVRHCNNNNHFLLTGHYSYYHYYVSTRSRRGRISGCCAVVVESRLVDNDSARRRHSCYQRIAATSRAPSFLHCQFVR